MAHGNTGRRHSAETKAKMSAAHTGKRFSSSSGKGTNGRRHSAFTIEKMRLAHTGKVHSPETKEKIRVAASRRIKTVIIDGVIYTSVAEAAKVLGMTMVTVYSRISKRSFPTWSYVSSEGSSMPLSVTTENRDT